MGERISNEIDKSVHLNISMNTALIRKLDTFCKDNGLARSSVIAVAVSEYLRKAELEKDAEKLLLDIFNDRPELLNIINKST